MLLSEASAVALVGEWETVSSGGWTAAESQSLVDAVRNAAHEVVPKIVDNTLSDADVQEYVLSRFDQAVCSWLTGPASRLRTAMRIDRVRVDSAGGIQLGLRSGTVDEIDGLAGIGPKKAEAIARIARLHPGVESIDDLDVLDDVGSATIASLKAAAYLDRPVVAFGSANLQTFATSPTVATLIGLLETSDVEVGVGDGTTWQRRGFAGGTVPERLTRMLEDFATQLEVALSPMLVPTGDSAEVWLGRTRKLAALDAAASSVSGQILVNAAYVSLVKVLLDEAQSSIRVMAFLGTAAAGDEISPGPLALIESLEERAAAGVSVRMILDTDDAGEPYGSAFINQPLVDRLAPTEVEVRYDPIDTLLHSKVVVIDDEVVVVGSHNWTRVAFGVTHELSVVCDSATLAGTFAARFDGLWASLPPI